MKSKIKLGIVLMFVILSMSIVLAAEWQSGVSYSIGDRVTYGGETYECLQAHTSQVGWNPEATPALWQKVTVVSDSNEWQSGKQYNIGDSVTYNSINYVVRQAHTSQLDWTPDITPALFLRDIEDSEKENLKTKLQNKYPDRFSSENIQTVKLSTTYSVYEVVVNNPSTGELENKLWIVKN